ncbi:MAG: hypothetical protein ACLQVY_27330 [Limisphaerales bacterium]
MRYGNRQVNTWFESESRFEITPIPSVPFRGTSEGELEQLKDRLLRQALQRADPELNVPLQRAANEAASLAWFTPFPLLVFPVLLEEKAAMEERQLAVQREIRQRSQDLVKAAAV